MSIFKGKEDIELFNQLKNNNSRALDELFCRYYQGLCHFSFQILKSVELAEEVVSDVFLNIWLKRDRIEIRTSLKAYLFTAVRNQSLNYNNKYSQMFFQDLEKLDKENLISEFPADQSVNYESTKIRIEDILSKLPEKRQLIFRMSRFDELSYKEIAEILNISVNTVQNQMIKAIQYIVSFRGKLD